MLSNMMRGNFTYVFFQIFIRLIVVMTALPIHEYAHGLVARKLGDHTAEMQGRLDLNPLRHFDIIGTTCLLLTGFGWAKPVPINPNNFKNRKSGMALTALAGPVSNIILAAVLMLFRKLIFYFVSGGQFVQILLDSIDLMIWINIGLAVFNLLPVPPLDGAKIFGYFLPDRIYWQIMQYERYIMIVLFILLFMNILNAPLNFISNFLYKGINFITGFVDIFAWAIIR